MVVAAAVAVVALAVVEVAAAALVAGMVAEVSHVSFHASFFYAENTLQFCKVSVSLIMQSIVSYFHALQS